MSGQNSKCPAKDRKYAGQNVRRGGNEFHVLCTVGKDPIKDVKATKERDNKKKANSMKCWLSG